MKKYKRRLPRFKIKITAHSSVVVYAPTVTQAKYKVWNQIKDGYTYGYKNRQEFMKGCHATKMS